LSITTSPLLHAAGRDEVSIIEPQDLAQAIDANTPLLLLQVTSPEVFLQAHIDGAVLVTPADLVGGEAPATGRLPSRERLEQLFRRIGFAADRPVVVYDDEGGGWAGRLAWTLDVIGQRSWQYLNGGLHAWHAAGFALAQGEAQGERVADGSHRATDPTPSDISVQIDHGPIAEIADVLATIDDPEQLVWDVRSAAEFAGERQGAARSGHIPGAVNLDWMALKDAQTQRIPDDLASRLSTAGVATDKRLITHCQTHHRSGLSYMLGRLLGLDIRAYHGSWSEWGNREDTPIENER